MKLSVIIPTKNRCATLEHTLKTIMNQSYEDFEVIVSDNFSEDGTRKVVEHYSDGRIKYYRTESRLGMSENWERALSKATGDYVTCLGDDDGFLQDSFMNVMKLIERHNAKAVIWRKSDYTWPDTHIDGGRLSVPLGNKLFDIDGLVLLRLVANAQTSYGRLPVIYSGFIRRENVLALKKSGKFFHSATPDIYSGIVLAAELGRYLYSTRPFSISGSCSTSNGLARGADEINELSQNFFQELQSPVHPKMPLIDGDAQVQSCIAEAYLQAQDLGLTANVKLNYKRHLNVIFDLIIKQNTLRKDQLEKFLKLELPRGLREEGERYLRKDVAIRKKQRNYGELANGTIILKNSDFGISNIHKAALFLSKILGEYQEPELIRRFGWVSILITVVIKKISLIFNRNLIEF